MYGGSLEAFADLNDAPGTADALTKKEAGISTEEEPMSGTDTAYAAWLGRREPDGSYLVEPDNMLFTDSLEEAQAFKSSHGLPLGWTVAISERDGTAYLITHEEGGYLAEVVPGS